MVNNLSHAPTRVRRVGCYACTREIARERTCARSLAPVASTPGTHARTHATQSLDAKRFKSRVQAAITPAFVVPRLAALEHVNQLVLKRPAPRIAPPSDDEVLVTVGRARDELACWVDEPVIGVRVDVPALEPRARTRSGRHAHVVCVELERGQEPALGFADRVSVPLHGHASIGRVPVHLQAARRGEANRADLGEGDAARENKGHNEREARHHRDMIAQYAMRLRCVCDAIFMMGANAAQSE